jgi:hypothetical protein
MNKNRDGFWVDGQEVGHYSPPTHNQAQEWQEVVYCDCQTT